MIGVVITIVVSIIVLIKIYITNKITNKRIKELEQRLNDTYIQREQKLIKNK